MWVDVLCFLRRATLASHEWAWQAGRRMLGCAFSPARPAWGRWPCPSRGACGRILLSAQGDMLQIRRACDNGEPACHQRQCRSHTATVRSRRQGPAARAGASGIMASRLGHGLDEMGQPPEQSELGCGRAR